MAMQPWADGQTAKMTALAYRHSNVFISIVRDRDTGSVFPDPTTGKPRIDYAASEFDREHAMEGVEAIAKICYVTGATEIRPHYPGFPSFIPDPAKQARHKKGEDPEFTDAEFAGWLKRMRRHGNESPTAVWSSAHQMGSCRMAADESQGVVDEQGRVFGRKGLYVADASVFHSASGVNPMITAMSIADWISRGVAKELGKAVP